MRSTRVSFNSRAHLEAATTKARVKFQQDRFEENIEAAAEPRFAGSPVKGKPPPHVIYPRKRETVCSVAPV